MSQDVIKVVADNITGNFSSVLEGLILVGSFARGEQIVKRNAEGKEIFISDLEFLAVIKPGAYPAAIDVTAIEKEIGVPVSVSIGQTTRSHLRRLKPYIFTVELKKHGKVLWGDPDVLKAVPDHSEKDIDPADGFVLLNNRIVEQLKLRLQIEKEPVEMYAFDKGYIQLVNSILAFKRRYRTLYQEKYVAFTALNIPTLMHLSAQVKDAIDNCKRKTPEVLPPSAGMRQWERLREAIKKVWLIEVRDMLNDQHMGIPQAIAEFPRSQSLGQRLKGWAKVIKQKKLSILQPAGFKTMLSRSPQYLIYQEAVGLYFGENFDRQRAEKIIDKWERIVK